MLEVQRRPCTRAEARAIRANMVHRNDVETVFALVKAARATFELGQWKTEIRTYYMSDTTVILHKQDRDNQARMIMGVMPVRFATWNTQAGRDMVARMLAWLDAEAGVYAPKPEAKAKPKRTRKAKSKRSGPMRKVSPGVARVAALAKKLRIKIAA